MVQIDEIGLGQVIVQHILNWVRPRSGDGRKLNFVSSGHGRKLGYVMLEWTNWVKLPYVYINMGIQLHVHKSLLPVFTCQRT